MREILFRGKRIDNGEWIDGNLFVPDEVTHRKAPTEILVGTNVVRISYEVDPATVGQYTGLTDKNGKRIFEGDVVTITDRFMKALDWTVEYRNCGFNVKHPLCAYWWSMGDLDGYTVEVVGNIHDNPELLKEG